MKLLIINGPNLNMLGVREPALYGNRTYRELEEYIRSCCDEIGAECTVRQSNHEGTLVDIIQDALNKYDGIVINAAAYTHTSVAILDALQAVNLPAVEVHLTEPMEREDFRHVSYVGLACRKRCAGKGFESYREGIMYLNAVLSGECGS